MRYSRCIFATLATILTWGVATRAEIPADYYITLDGKSGAELTTALQQISATHTVISYGEETWGAFEKTDMRIVGGREAWWDMYSNNLVYLPDHGALNIEHSVAKSWWNSVKNNAYSDLFHLNPSDQNANNKKGNYPPGIVADARLLDNGLTRIGTPAAGYGGGSANVFEPADEYKGDFARAYFYIFTAYPDLAWQNDYAYVYQPGTSTLQPWAVELLLAWNESDPVDSKELSRNEEIFQLQGNRNPFIDYPALANYIWKESTDIFHLSDYTPSQAIDRPEAPSFPGSRLTGVNTYSRRWWDGIIQPVETDNGKLMVSYDGGEWFSPSFNQLDIAASSTLNEQHVWRAYTIAEGEEGRNLRSPISELRITSLSPETDDYSQAHWAQALNTSELEEGVKYIILSSNTLHVMRAGGGTSQMQFMESAGFVEFDTEGRVIELPADAAIVEFAKADAEGRMRLMVEDTHGNFLGNWNATAKNKMRLDATQYKPGTPSFSSSGYFDFTFTEFGSLQFNKTQPRFLQYESGQTPVVLYKFIDHNGGTSGIGSVMTDAELHIETPWSVGVDGRCIIAPAGSLVYDLGGRSVDTSRPLSAGIYIVASGKGESVKVIIR